MRIVFVCTTNVWGSAMADLMARSLLAEWDPDRKFIQVASVGVRARIGAPIPAEAQHVLAKYNLQAHEHRARWMSAEILTGADLVLTMGTIQRQAVLALNPRGLRSTFTVLEAQRLLGRLDARPPVVPEADRHAHALVAELANARRLGSAPDDLDDLPDIVTDSVELNELGNRLDVAIRVLLRAFISPGFTEGISATCSAPRITPDHLLQLR